MLVMGKASSLLLLFGESYAPLRRYSARQSQIAVPAMPSAPPRSPDPSERTLDALVSAAQYEMVVDRSRSSNLISVPFGAVVVWVLWGAVDHRLLLAWLGLKVAGSAVRIGVTFAFDRHRPDG